MNKSTAAILNQLADNAANVRRHLGEIQQFTERATENLENGYAVESTIDGASYLPTIATRYAHSVSSLNASVSMAKAVLGRDGFTLIEEALTPDTDRLGSTRFYIADQG